MALCQRASRRFEGLHSISMSYCECEKELSQQSIYSPCAVAHEEMIVYALVDPLTVWADGSVKEISKSDLKASTLSVCRAQYSTGAEAQAAIIGVKPNRVDHGYYMAKCYDIRSILLPSSEQGFCVIDDGLADYSAHAHIGYSIPAEEKSRSGREATRANLLKLFRKLGAQHNWNGPPFAG